MSKQIICANCGQGKPHKAKGLCEKCYKHCYYHEHREERASLGRLYRQEHREEIAAYQCLYGEEHREEQRIRSRRWYEEHQEEVVTYNRQYHQAHREESLARQARWQKENPEKRAGWLARRLAQKQRLPDTLTPAQAEQLFAIGRAIYPGEKLHLDHIVPLSRGGGTTRANMHAIPARVNLSKRNLLPQEVYQQLAMGGGGMIWTQ